jgi:hypothetical protein
MSTPREDSVQVIRPAPPTREAARRRIVDMRHPSTGSDRPTVRGGESGGQTLETTPGASLWMTSCSVRDPVVTFHVSAVASDHGSSRVHGLL